MKNFLYLTLLLLAGCASDLQKQQTGFIDKMVSQHQFKEDDLQAVFAQVEIKDDILKKIAKPSEAMPWHKYRAIFMTDKRIDGGVQFWQANAATLAAVEQQTGVPPEIIVAILGVETSYGQHTGKYRVIDALSTLAFAYPPRSPFFTGELENFLLLCRDEQLDPLQPTGSYAGAMGMPQFMPSSYRHFSVDFDQDRRRDIWKNPADSIASVAHYFAEHHWQREQTVAVPVSNPNKSTQYKNALTKDLKPHLRLADLESLDLKISQPVPADSKLTLLAFELADGEALWAAFDNFYVITRYNHSPLYALAVYQLSQAILEKKGRTHEKIIYGNIYHPAEQLLGRAD
ncbi:lytic murein transglycosylase B [Methylosoma difficile]